MRLWSEEQRLGTMELMLTMPLAPWHAILGKYLAAAVVLFVMLVLSFPIVWTINFLGEPTTGSSWPDSSRPTSRPSASSPSPR